MSSKNWIVPLPPGYRHQGRETVGVIPCHGHDCAEWALVRLDKKGWPYAPCDKALSVRGCGRRYDLIPADIPPQTREHFEAMKGDLEHMPADIRDFVLKAWGHNSETTHETIAKPIKGESEPATTDTAPAGTDQDSPADAGTAPSEPADIPAEAGNGPGGNSDSTGPEEGVEPVTDYGIFSM